MHQTRGAKTLQTLSLEAATKHLTHEPEAFSLVSKLPSHLQKTIFDRLLAAKQKLDHMETRLPLIDRELLMGVDVNSCEPWNSVDVREYGFETDMECFDFIRNTIRDSFKPLGTQELSKTVLDSLNDDLECHMVLEQTEDLMSRFQLRAHNPGDGTGKPLEELITPGLLLNRLVLLFNSSERLMLSEPEGDRAEWGLTLQIGPEGAMRFLYGQNEELLLLDCICPDATVDPNVLLGLLLSSARLDAWQLRDPMQESFARRYIGLVKDRQ